MAFQVPVDNLQIATRALHLGKSKPRRFTSGATLAHVSGQVDPESEGLMAGEAYHGAPTTARTLLDTAAGGLCRLHGQR